jgi:hypothetical protein
MGLIATARRGTTASQDAPQRHAKGAARVEARDASQATGTRQSATSSQGEPTQAAQPISGQHDADREAKPSRDPAERPET